LRPWLALCSANTSATDLRGTSSTGARGSPPIGDRILDHMAQCEGGRRGFVDGYQDAGVAGPFEPDPSQMVPWSGSSTVAAETSPPRLVYRFRSCGLGGYGTKTEPCHSFSVCFARRERGDAALSLRRKY
jgi:hypothetical protein